MVSQFRNLLRKKIEKKESNSVCRGRRCCFMRRSAIRFCERSSHRAHLACASHCRGDSRIARNKPYRGRSMNRPCEKLYHCAPCSHCIIPFPKIFGRVGVNVFCRGAKNKEGERTFAKVLSPSLIFSLLNHFTKWRLILREVVFSNSVSRISSPLIFLKEGSFLLRSVSLP